MRLAWALALPLWLAAPASADQLVFDCGPNICRVRPDGTGLRQLTTEWTAAQRAGGAAITRDGTRVAYTFAGGVYTRDTATGAPRFSQAPFVPALVRFRPDGMRYAVAESATIGGTQVCAYNTDLSGTDNGRYCLATGVSSAMDYLPDGRLLMATTKNGRSEIALLRPEDGGPSGVERTIVRDEAADLESPSVAPDGRFVAVVRGGVRGDIAIYDLGSGAPVRALTTGGGAAQPAFAPDGRSVAFDRDGGVWVVPAAGGTAEHVAQGTSVAWGGGDVPPAFSRVRATGRPGRVRVALRVAVAGSSVLIEVRKGAKRLARDLTRRAPLAGGAITTTFSGPRLRGRLSVRLTVTAPGATPERRTVTLRA